MMRRMLFWNEHSFFRKLEKRTGKEIFSAYPPEADREIYERDYWWTDSWDPLSYGREIDWTKPFLQQIHELELVVPMPARSILRTVNCDYSNEAADMKNCYLCFNADQCEDCFYSVGLLQLKNCVDVFRVTSSEFVYDSFGTFNSYQSFFVDQSTNNRNVWLSYDCEDCSDCFGCVNLRHKQFNIFNQQYSKEDYVAKIKGMNLGSFESLSALKQKFVEHKLKYPRKYMAGTRNVNVTGGYIRNSKNVKASYAGVNCENVAYSQSMIMGVKDSYDYTNWGNNTELTYETQSVGENVQRVKFTYQSFNGVSDIEYCVYCPSSNNLFGCVGMHKKEYCILNRQYSKEEYNALIPKIKKHMMEMPYVDKQGRIYKYGEFFPLEFSPLAVNESAVMDFMAMDKEKAARYGLVWRDTNPKEYQSTMKAADLPDHISEVKDEIVKEVIACGGCNRGYRIVPGELVFLRRFGIPLPRLCFNCRHKARVGLRNLPVWYNRACQCGGLASTSGVYPNVGKHSHGAAPCQEQFLTTYGPERAEIVYCESCHQQEVV